VEDVDLSKSVFARLRGVHYDYREDHPHADRYRDWDREARRGTTGRLGLIYEDVAEAAPEWVYEIDGMKAVSYEGMLPDLIGDYISLRAEVLRLRDEVADLKKAKPRRKAAPKGDEG